MALTIKGVPDTRQYVGPDAWSHVWAAANASADYAAGGYNITASSLGYIRFTWVAVVADNNNGTTGWLSKIYMNYAATPLGGVTSVNLQVFVTGASSGALLAEISNGNTGLNGTVWTLYTVGY